MTLSSTQAAAKINAMNVAFDKIGHHNGHSMPQSNNNRDPIAWELFVAQHLYKIADGRRKNAHAAAVTNGVLFDHTSNPRTPGDYSVYDGDILTFQCNVKNPASTVDAKKLQSELIKAGVDAMIVQKCVAAATVERAAPHTFTGALKTE